MLHFAHAIRSAGYTQISYSICTFQIAMFSGKADQRFWNMERGLGVPWWGLEMSREERDWARFYVQWKFPHVLTSKEMFWNAAHFENSLRWSFALEASDLIRREMFRVSGEFIRSCFAGKECERWVWILLGYIPCSHSRDMSSLPTFPDSTLGCERSGELY